MTIYRVSKFLLLLLLVSLPLLAFAEGSCPPGFYPIGGQGVQGCAPIPGAATTGSEAGIPAPAPRPTGYWEQTWGAISIAKSTGDIGVTYGKSSKSEADSDALGKCATYGAKDCRISLSYKNQCAAIAKEAKGAYVHSGRSSSIERATGIAMKGCIANTGGACEVVHTNCSEPIFHKY